MSLGERPVASCAASSFRAAVSTLPNESPVRRMRAESPSGVRAKATAEKVVRRQLDETEQRRLIDEAMADVDFSQFAPAESGTPAEGGE